MCKMWTIRVSFNNVLIWWSDLLLMRLSKRKFNIKNLHFDLLSDIDECTLLINNCEQICVDTIGSFNCSCRDGFVLNSDQSSCSRGNLFIFCILYIIQSDILTILMTLSQNITWIWPDSCATAECYKVVKSYNFQDREARQSITHSPTKMSYFQNVCLEYVRCLPTYW